MQALFGESQRLGLVVSAAEVCLLQPKGYAHFILYKFSYNYSTKWEFHGTRLRPMGTPTSKTTDGSVLSAQTHGETHRQNDTSLAGRPKYTNPYPWRDPCRGIHKGGSPPFVEAARNAASSIWVSPCVRVRVFGTPGQRCVVLPMGFPMGLSTEH